MIPLAVGVKAYLIYFLFGRVEVCFCVNRVKKSIFLVRTLILKL